MIQRRYIGIASKLTKKPENRRKGTDITGAKKTPFWKQITQFLQISLKLLIPSTTLRCVEKKIKKIADAQDMQYRPNGFQLDRQTLCEILLFWTVIPCELACRYHPWRWRYDVSPKHWYLPRQMVLWPRKSTPTNRHYFTERLT